MPSSLWKVVGIVAIIAVFIILIAQFTGGNIPENKPIECYNSGTCVPVIYDIKIDKGFAADPNLVSISGSLNREIATSLVAFDVVPNAVDVETKITTEGNEYVTSSCRISAEGGNCHNYLRVWYDLKTNPTISKTLQFELFDSTSGSSWGDQATCTFSISKNSVTIISGSPKCGAISITPTPTIQTSPMPTYVGGECSTNADCERAYGVMYKCGWLIQGSIHACERRAGCVYNDPICGSGYYCDTSYDYRGVCTYGTQRGCAYSEPPCSAPNTCVNNACVFIPTPTPGVDCRTIGCPTNQVCILRSLGSGQAYLCQATLAYVCSASNPCPQGQYCASNNRCATTI